MVQTNVGENKYNGVSCPDAKKMKDERPSSGHRQQQWTQPGKNDKYGCWGSVYKNKQHFIDMHIC